MRVGVIVGTGVQVRVGRGVLEGIGVADGRGVRVGVGVRVGAVVAVQSKTQQGAMFIPLPGSCDAAMRGLIPLCSFPWQSEIGYFSKMLPIQRMFWIVINFTGPATHASHLPSPTQIFQPAHQGDDTQKNSADTKDNPTD